MFTVSNILSFLRMPLAFLFLQKNIFVRFIAILFAMITDTLDGHIARKRHETSKFGAILDPTMDKFFVYFALFIFYYENTISFSSAITLLSRDFAIIIYGLYLIIFKRVRNWHVKALRFGKIFTALQFIVLIFLTFHIQIHPSLYFIFVMLGFLALLELFYRKLDKTKIFITSNKKR